ncbi:MAG: amidohydrolase family protein [bacterium]|jgi:predicted TIM-barrel fold metal-dependent hydrolase|nr:amidohydrolase family protein [bacterium]
MAATIDCDVHNEVPSIHALVPYLPPYWVEQVRDTIFTGPLDSYYPVSESRAPLEGVRAWLDETGPAAAILSCTYAIDSLHNPDQAVALARAINDWQVAEWLVQDPRLRASIVVPSQLPALAAEEIERVAEHPGFVQVLLPARSHHPYGSRLYIPLWEAIARHGLVGGIHFGGAPGNASSPSGWPSYFLEEYAGAALTFATQVTSLVTEGVFDRFPELRVTLLESGCTWLPPHLWRFDKEWKNLRRQVPWVRRPPSEYVRDHVRLTITPLDAPGEPGQLPSVVEELGSPDLLLYASDYPHLHGGDPERDVLAHLDPELGRRIREDNARAWYGL